MTPVLLSVLLLSDLGSLAGAAAEDPATAKAQEQKPYEGMSLEDLLKVRLAVTSTRGDDILAAPSTVSVIDADTIRRYNLRSVAEALELVPGLDVKRTYFKRNVATARGILQDHYANKVLVLINGVATWHASTGEGAFYRIPIEDVERIEVLRGPASVLYGTNAYSGAVNIVLKRPEARQAQVDLGLAERGGHQVGASAGGVVQGVSVLAAARSFDDEGRTFIFTDEKGLKGPVGELERGDLFTLTASGRGHSLLANVFTYDEGFLGTNPVFSSGTGLVHTSEGRLLSYGYTRELGGKGRLTGGAVYDWSQRDFARSADDSQASNVEGYRILGFARSSWTPSPSWGMDLGLDYEYRKSIEYSVYQRSTGVASAQNNMHNRDLTEYSAYAEVSHHRGRFDLRLGSRLTKNELFGGNLSSRAALVFAANEKNSLKLIWGQSYRAPSLFELYFQTPQNTVYGNLDLKPETSDTLELAYVTSFRGLFLQALAYHATYENKIARVSRYPRFTSDSKDTSTVYMNGGNFKADGIELELRYDRPRLANAFLSLDYVKGNSGDALPGSNRYNFRFAPELSVSAGLAKSLHGVSASAVVNHQTDCNGTKAEVPGHTTLDASLGYEHSLGRLRVQHSLYVKNATDEDAPTPEYVRGNINEVPLSLGRRAGYRLRVQF